MPKLQPSESDVSFSPLMLIVTGVIALACAGFLGFDVLMTAPNNLPLIANVAIYSLPLFCMSPFLLGLIIWRRVKARHLRGEIDFRGAKEATGIVITMLLNCYLIVVMVASILSATYWLTRASPGGV